MCYIKYKTKRDAGSRRECVHERVYDIHRYRVEGLISSEISDFSGPTLLSLSHSFLYYPSTSSPLSPPRATLYTKQSNLEPVARTTVPTIRATVRWQFIYPEHLYNNLLTRYVFLARETTFFTFSLYLSAACYRERIALLCDFWKQCTSLLTNMILKTWVFFFLLVYLLTSLFLACFKNQI